MGLYPVPRPFVPVSVSFVDSSMYALSRLSFGGKRVTVNRIARYGLSSFIVSLAEG